MPLTYSLINRSCPSIRAYLNAGGALAGAGILALGLVTAPPDSHGARAEVRAVQFSSFALPAVATLTAFEKFLSIQYPTDGPADIPAALLKTANAGATTALTFDTPNDSATSNQEVEAAALASPTAAASIADPILGIVSPILGLLTNPAALLLFAPIILLVVIACPPCALVSFATGIIQSFLIGLTPVPAVALAATTAVDETATAAASLRVPTTPDPVTPANTPADATPAVENGEADAPPSVTSTKDVTDKTDQESTEPEAVSTPESAAAEARSEPVKPKVRLATPRPVVRDSLDVSKQLPDQPHRAKGGRPTSETTGADGAATSESSSTATQSGDSSPEGGGASDGDAAGSE